MHARDKDPRAVPTSNSSSESDQKRERIESYKDARRRELSAKYGPRHDPTTKSFKATRKKEDLRGGGACGPFLKSYLNSQNQVPLSDSRRSLPRRDGNKTDSNTEEPGGDTRGGASSPREPVYVRETKASRLRAASRTPTSDVGSLSPRSFKNAKKSDKERTPMSASPTFSSPNRKDVDKSHSRKSFLNRSHTSEGVYDDIYVPEDSKIRRRRTKNLNLDSFALKNSSEKILTNATMGNSPGTVKNSSSFDRSNQLAEGSMKSHRLTSNVFDKHLLEPSSTLKMKTPIRTSPENNKRLSTNSKSKQIDIAARAEILAASTLKMINRLDEINKSRQSQESLKKPPSAVTSSNHSEVSDDATAKSSSNHIRKKPSLSPKRSQPEVVKPSILKNKPPSSTSAVDPQKPVSILKRKSLSQEDSQSCSSPPVTFSPSVLKKENDKKQGILKKRRSLDESEVMRRRSYSPSDFKSILKTQRRSSMEELTRSHSPDSTPQGILKRKSSKEEETEDGSEPQGILKRKQTPSLNSHQHVKIADSVPGDVTENVRPILKKKSSSEEYSTSDPSLTEVPKSILKKKTSVEADDTDEKPKKPILKTSRIPSFEEKVSGATDEPKPILKTRTGEDSVVLRRTRTNIQRPHSSSDIDSELSAIFLKRRSLEFQPVCAINFDCELQRTKRASSNEKLRGGFLKRPLSVAEKINNLENFLEVERIERERRNSPPGTPPALLNLKKDECPKLAASYSTDTLPKLMSDMLLGGPCHSEAGSGSDKQSSTPDKTSEPCFTPSVSNSSLKSSSDVACNVVFSAGDSSESLKPTFSGSSFLSFDSERNSKSDGNDCYFSLESCGEKISSLSLKETSTSAEDFMDAEERCMLQRSGSVSAKASLFKEIEKKYKVDAEQKKIPKGSAGINRRHEKKLLESNAQRYHTQPVSSEEVELAVRKSKITTEEKNKDEGENHEDELCTMSYKDRLRLFESTFANKLPDPSPRKRSTRFRTQPVTTNEVETAKSQRTNSASKQPEEDSSSVSSLKENLQEEVKLTSTESRTKPKGILKNLNHNVEPKKSESESDSSDSSEKRGILNNELNESFRNLKKVLRKIEKETTSELKGILKQPSFEKNVTSSSEEEPTETSPKSRSLGANLADILQRVEPVDKSVEKEPSGDFQPGKLKSKHMENPGIARVINKLRNNSSIAKSQSHSSVSSVLRPSSRLFPEGSFMLNGDERKNGELEKKSGSKDETDEAQLRGLRRSTTQVLASDESKDDDMSGASIRERLARLKRSGELDWQKRKSHVTNLEDELSVITAGNYLFNENCLLRENHKPSIPQASKESEESKNSSSILADRLGKLDAAKEGWKKRIKPSDAVRFSVEGKMLEKRDSLSPPNATIQISPSRTPLAERKKKSPKAVKFRSKQNNPSLNSVPSSPVERLTNPIARSVSAPGSGRVGLFSLADDANEANGPVVSVPKTDDEAFTSFFHKLNTEQILREGVEINDEDLDAVTRIKSSHLLVQKRNIKTQKRRATVKNPVKALAARLDLQEYTEIKTGIAEKELKRMKIEKAAKNSTLAIEALAGLASQEDFTAISLKKASEGGISSPDAPYKDLMLLQVKGRRHVQTRLVEPVATNVNAGDCFILVTGNKVFNYVGEFANVIERSRSAEIALHIQQKGDLGCTATSVITIGEGGRATKSQVDEFWKLLGGTSECEQKAGSVDEDELFESALIDTNMVYEMVEDELVPNEAYWGTVPKIQLLDPNKVLIFDFGSEFYVWNGKNVTLPKRKAAMKVAKELWQEGYDYTECDLCPLTAASHLRSKWEEIPDKEKAGPVRPKWALFAKITQNMETVLFREKFLDWPDYTRVIRRNKKNKDSDQGDANGILEVKPCDAKKMLENVVPEPDLLLEGNHLGRGIRYFDEETRRCSEIGTQDVKVWHVREYEYEEVEPDSIGQFHTEDSYVVRWHYIITITGRELSGQPSKHLTTGRNRYAYFFWQGRDSPINDKGAAACLTVELDKEHGPQVRVVQGYEPPAFLNLFKGKMVVHRGRRSAEAPRENQRLFICRGEVESEAILFEVPCSMRQLRSLASFLLVNKDTGKIIVWHGWKAPEHARKIALGAAKRLQVQTPEFEFNSKEITIREELEGSESHEFIRALGGDNRQLYFSLLDDKTEVRTPRLFHLSSVSGEFHFNEISPSYFTKESPCPLPFLQNDLYSASQPALFLLDSPSGLWLWQGWWEEGEESERGSCYIRFQAERRAAMSTAMTYWSLKYGSSSPKAYLIWAGLEPLVFTNQFPFWKDRDDIAEINMKDGRKPGEAMLVKSELASLTQSTYPLAELQNRPLPDGVNPTTLEDYLEPKCFPELFGLEKEEFLNLPSWKKKKLKQEAGLF